LCLEVSRSEILNLIIADLSSGPDTSPVVYPFRTAGKENHRVLSHLPQQTNLQSAPKARLVLSWWGNEICIWHLLRPARRLLDGETTGTDIRKNRKLISQIKIQGESNITSAAISSDGTLLLASTATEVKAFQLHYDGTSHIDIRKVKVGGASHGATKVEISPDNHWAFWVEEGAKVMIARVTTAESETGPVHTISLPRKLSRIRRDVPKHLALGGLGSYDRKVSQVAFSLDSKMLSVADLAGYIDTWVLRAPGEQQNGTGDATNDTSSSDSSDDSSDDSEEEEEEEEAAERWYPNPKGKLLPKLDTAPVVLTFSPGHHEDGDYSLVVITALKDLFLFNPLRGALSDWSRRNPSSKLPEQFRLSRDIIKGVVWQGPRAWVYGYSFLTMLDLSQDLPEPSHTGKDWAKKGTKRKRHEHNAGAGGKINKEHSLVPQQIKAATAPDSNEYMDVDMDDQKSVAASSAYEDDDDDTDGGELQRLRDDTATNGEDAGDAEKEAFKPKTWNTYQYRPILGIVPLESKPPKEKKKKGAAKKETAMDTLPPLEVALVERPTWDLDLPARYLADGEWER
jgi:U3 small nucleolar RNA-associated protein 4